MFSLEEIIEKICKHAGYTEEKVNKLIEEKEEELSGLVSKEGAAYIVARELGISLLKETKRQLKIKNLVEGLRSVELVGKVIDVSDIREFERNGQTGSVLNILLGDETGVVRLSLWNDEVSLVKELDIKPDDVVKITRGFVRLDNRGNLELRLGRGRIEKVDEVVNLPESSQIAQKFTAVKRKEIKDLKEGDYAEVRAALVQVFRKNPFYEICPTCGLRLAQDKEKWICKEHGEVKPDYQVVISGVIDDGTGNIRVVFFRNLAEKLAGKTIKEMRKEAEKKADSSVLFENFEALGKEYIITGRVKKNEITENLELIANDIKDINPREECENLIKELESLSE
ncbi:MAG: hypothetical protein DRP13_02840 [Candidatus Aenigmatarchaeota archaeon]|nr:MAG: hypothetical protein DRP13_02840 [Candidatus Aenigmarchaeota archaeon]